MDTNEFMAAVSAARVGANDKAANAFPNAAAGDQGGFPAGEAESYPVSSEFATAVGYARPAACGCAAYSYGDAPDGTMGFVRGDRSIHDYMPSGEMIMAAGNTCVIANDKAANAYPDAPGGGLGHVSDSDKA
jgi:hypothetical protein